MSISENLVSLIETIKEDSISKINQFLYENGLFTKENRRLMAAKIFCSTVNKKISISDDYTHLIGIIDDLLDINIHYKAENITITTMFSEEANEKVRQMVLGLMKNILKDKMRRDKIVNILNVGISEIAKEFGEVRDLAVREQICFYLDWALLKNNMNELTISDFTL